MLSFDLDGKLIPPAKLVKTIGGDIDTRSTTLPAGLELKTGGVWDGVSLANTPSDEHFSKRLTRTTLGRARVQTNSNMLFRGNMMALNVRAVIKGGGSSSNVGNTNRSLKIGVISDDNRSGSWVEYEDPTKGASGSFMSSINAVPTITRKPINYQINNPAEFYCVSYWITPSLTDGFDCYVEEAGNFRHVKSFTSTEMQLARFRGFIDWDWSGPLPGTFLPEIAHLSMDIHFDYR